MFQILDCRKSHVEDERFLNLKNDNDKMVMPILASTLIAPSQCTALMLSNPDVKADLTYVSDQYVVLCPSFKVSTAELYELPPCYLPKGTRLSDDSIVHAQDYVSIIGSLVNACASRREKRDHEKNWLENSMTIIENLRKAGQIEEADKLERKRQATEHQRMRDLREQQYQELLQQIEKALRQINVSIDATSKPAPPKAPDTPSTVRRSARGISTQTAANVDPRIKLMNWLETQYLLCVAFARLKELGPVVFPQEDPEEADDEITRMMLDHCTRELLKDCTLSPPSSVVRDDLRAALNLAKEECDPVTRIMKLLPRPKWEDFMIKEATNGSETSCSSSSSTTEVSGESSQETNDEESSDTTKSPE